jgi:hypothetical protein
MMLKVTPLVLTLVGMGFAAELMGSLAHPLTLFLALAFTALAVLVARPERSLAFRPLFLIIAVAAFLCGILLLAIWPAGRANRLLAVAVLLAASDAGLRAFGMVRRDLYPAVVVSLFAALLFLVLDWSPPARTLWQQASLGLSHLSGAVLDRPLALGPSFSGSDSTLLFLLLALVVFALTSPRKWLRLAIALAYLPAVLFCYHVLMTQLPNFNEPQAAEVAARLGKSAGAWLGPLLTRHVPWNMPALLFLFQLPAVLIIGARVTLHPVDVVPETLRRLARAGALCGVLLAAAGVLVIQRAERPEMFSPSDRAVPRPIRETEITVLPGRSRVVLYQKGYLNWEEPTFASFGAYSSGMLGRLPVFLRQLGFEVVMSDRLDAQTLVGARIVAIFNPNALLPAREHEALWDFVRRGGSLLVVGEHTWLTDNDEDALNDLLSPSDIRFNFDTATFQTGGWLEGYAFAADPMYHHMRDDMNQPGVVAGASLEVGLDAEPLLFGAMGYSDWGVRERRDQLGFLGDNRYLPGEQLGDVILLAGQRLGAGRVVAVGDTTGFFNLLMVGSDEAVSRLFGKLACSPLNRRHWLRLAASLVFLTAGLAMTLASASRSILPFIIAGVVSGFAAQASQAHLAAPIDLVPAGDIAYIDDSHVGVFSRDTWRDDGLAGLYLNLMRNGMQPLRMDRFSPERLRAAKALFIIAPEMPCSPGELDVIEKFIGDGGYVVVSAGADSADAVRPLLKRFGLNVSSRPLGPFMTQCQRASSMVRFRVAYIIEDETGQKADVLASYEPQGMSPTIIERLHPQLSSGVRSRGGLLLIGDGQFFLNENLEPEKDEPVRENVNFLRWLVPHMRRSLREERQP